MSADWQPLSMEIEGIWLAMKPGCPIAGCDWGTTVTSINTPDGRVDPASDALALLLGTIEHLREDHDAAYPWEAAPGDDRRISLQLEPEQVERLIELLKHIYGMRARYTEGTEAAALAEELRVQMERQR